MRYLLPLLLVCFFHPSASAARLLTFTIEVNGKPMLIALGTDNGLADTATVWSYLQSSSFKPEENVKLPLATPNAKAVTLEGKMVLRVSHAGRTLAEASLDELVLVRNQGIASGWLLPVHEVERTARAAGLKLPTSGVQGQLPVWIWWLTGLMVIVILVETVRVYVKRKKRLMTPAPATVSA